MSCSFKMDQFKTAIKDDDIDKALELKQEFNLDLKLALFDAIRDDEEFAMSLIDASDRIDLPLSEANEDNQTPLLLACGLEKPKVALAILKKGKSHDIAINTKDGYGRTPLLWACKNGWTDSLAKIYEVCDGADVELDLNTKDKGDMTGFILACKEKHSLLITGLIGLSLDEDINIDLQAKDCYGRSGFDYLPPRYPTKIQLR